MLIFTGLKKKFGKRLLNEVVCDLCSHTHWVENRHLDRIHRCKVCFNLGSLCDRIRSHICYDGSCHVWIGNLTHDGYAVIGVGKKKIRVAKHLLESKLGRKLLSGKETCHKCNRRDCVNLEHVYEGTHKRNMEDMAKAGSVKGSKQGNAKIDENTARSVKNLLDKGYRVRDIANRLGVPQSTVGNIKYRNCWDWL